MWRREIPGFALVKTVVRILFNADMFAGLGIGSWLSSSFMLIAFIDLWLRLLFALYCYYNVFLEYTCHYFGTRCVVVLIELEVKY